MITMNLVMVIMIVFFGFFFALLQSLEFNIFLDVFLWFSFFVLFMIDWCSCFLMFGWVIDTFLIYISYL